MQRERERESERETANCCMLHPPPNETVARMISSLAIGWTVVHLVGLTVVLLAQFASNVISALEKSAD